MYSAAPIQGRLSPVAKERLYRTYQQGATVKDLSLKYGILPERVKAIVFQKHLYWEEIYPRLGETHMRAAFERELMYGAEFPFMDYGIDLKEMAKREKGVKIQRFTNTFTDVDPVKKESEQKEIDSFLSKQRSRKMDKIPIDFVGKGPKGYTLFDMVHHRGKSSPKLN